MSKFSIGKYARTGRLSRRNFLKGLGGATIALPLLSSGLRGLNAQEISGPLGKNGFPKRFLVIFHPNGVMPDEWFPTAGSTARNFTLGPTHQATLSKWKENLILFKGMDIDCGDAGPGEPHQTGMGGLLTGRPLQEGDFVGGDGSLAGWGDGISVDQVIAGKIGETTSLKSLQLGVRASSNGGSEVRTRLIYSGPGTPLPPIDDPRLVFDRLVSKIVPDDTTQGGLASIRGSILDTVGDEFEAIRGRAGFSDRQRLDDHLAYIRDLERRLGNSAVMDACVEPTRPIDQEPDSEDTMPEIAKLQIDLMVLALACDITRVGSIQFSNAKNHIRFPWLDSYGDGHALSHAGPSNMDARAQWLLRDEWFARQLAYLIERLESVKEEDGTTLFDNTAILWINELAVGNTHAHENMPFLIAAGHDSGFDTNQFVELNATPHNNLLVSLLNAYGIENTTFGDSRFCTGPIAGLVKA